MIMIKWCYRALFRNVAPCQMISFLKAGNKKVILEKANLKMRLLNSI